MHLVSSRFSAARPRAFGRPCFNYYIVDAFCGNLTQQAKFKIFLDLQCTVLEKWFPLVQLKFYEPRNFKYYEVFLQICVPIGF